MKIGIGNDHSALELKAEIISFCLLYTSDAADE